jgi:hypothetical protein
VLFVLFLIVAACLSFELSVLGFELSVSGWYMQNINRGTQNSKSTIQN